MNSQPFKPDYIIHHGDSLRWLADLARNEVRADLIVTSPPYNVGKEYEKAMPVEIYAARQERYVDACVGILKPGGSICWQVGSMILGSGWDKETVPLDLLLHGSFKRHGLVLRNRIVWTYGFGHHDSVRFSGRHETILWYTKPGGRYRFNLDAVRVPQKYPNKKHFAGPKKGRLSGNPLGKNPGDVWDIPNVKHNHREKTEHPAQYPIALVERLVLALTDPGELVIDPFLGSGTTLLAALLHGRRCYGAERESRYIDISLSRLGELQRGVLPVRDGSPPYSPKGDRGYE